ncbi:MAG: hypothetical protein NTW59_03230 [Candidatus Diapherotrites archaeon]|nr:hypothetical protein [Candidatus Diapherotrites archaeon]
MIGEKARLATIAVFLFFLLAAALLIHPAGQPGNAAMDDYFIGNGQAETGSNNIVTSVVFDYRGMDTLIEASVLCAAATGVFLAMGRQKDEE